MITLDNIISDLVLSIPFLLWVLFVIQYLSRWVYKLALNKGYPAHSATYFGRKVIHIFAAGLMTLALPFLFKEPLIPFFSGLFLALYTSYFRQGIRIQDWYQVRENHHEVNFCIMWSLSILVGWFIDRSFWLGVIPALFMAFGDGVTGIVRNLKHQRRGKDWEGSLAMFVVCSLIGGARMGWAGIVAAITATLFEQFEDDNVYVPVFSFLVLSLFYYFYPQLTVPFV